MFYVYGANLEVLWCYEYNMPNLITTQSTSVDSTHPTMAHPLTSHSPINLLGSVSTNSIASHVSSNTQATIDNPSPAHACPKVVSVPFNEVHAPMKVNARKDVIFIEAEKFKELASVNMIQHAPQSGRTPRIIQGY